MGSGRDSEKRGEMGERKRTGLVSVQSSSQVSRPSHELLVLVLLHLQLSLSLDADGPETVLLSSLLESLSALVHAIAEAGGHSGVLNLVLTGKHILFHDKWGAVRAVGDLTVGVGGFLDCEDGAVGLVLRLQVCDLESFHIGCEGFGGVHGSRWRRWVEGAVVGIKEGW
jgi:hypothetical protein